MFCIFLGECGCVDSVDKKAKENTFLCLWLHCTNTHILILLFLCEHMCVCVCVFTDFGLCIHCVLSNGNWDSFLSDQSVIVSLSSLYMFVLFAKHSPINSAWIRKKKANREQTSSKPPNCHARPYLIFSVLSAQAARPVHCLVKSWRPGLMCLFKKKHLQQVYRKGEPFY